MGMKIKTTRDFLERALALYEKHPLCNDTYVAFSVPFYEMLEEGDFVHAHKGKFKLYCLSCHLLLIAALSV